MANSPYLVDWAISHGANGVEMDLNFTAAGDLESFFHGFPCECTLPHLEGICSVADCATRSSVGEMIRHIAVAQPGVALVVIDTKSERIASNVLEHAGNILADEIVTALYNQGYDGNIVISVPRLPQIALIDAACKRIRTQSPQLLPRVRFTVDGESDHTDRVISSVFSVTSQIAYGTGISAMLPGDFCGAIDFARSRGVPFTYIWTIDNTHSMARYLDHGVAAIITNQPERLKDLLKQRGLPLARMGDRFTCP